MINCMFVLRECLNKGHGMPHQKGSHIRQNKKMPIARSLHHRASEGRASPVRTMYMLQISMSQQIQLISGN